MSTTIEKKSLESINDTVQDGNVQNNDEIQNNEIENTSNNEIQNNEVVARDKYLFIINKILSNNLLKQKIEKWTEAGALNLIQPEWKNVLYNDPLFQKYKNKQVFYSAKKGENKHFTKYYIVDRDDRFDVLVCGYFRVTPNTATVGNNGCIVVEDCPPVEEIGNAIITKEPFLKNCKFYIPTCGGICPACRPINIEQDNLWCIQNTLVLTPEGISKASRGYFESVFNMASLAIMRLDINMFYDFNAGSKVGGNIKNICFIQECLLNPQEENAGEILTIATPTSTPVNKRLLLEEETIYAIPEKMLKTTSEPLYEVSTSKLNK